MELNGVIEACRTRSALAGGSKFGEISPIYAHATENLAGYLPELCREGDRAVCVCGSGDPAISLALLGAHEVRCFDINRLAGLWLELKLVAMQSLSYNGYLELFGLAEHRNGAPAALKHLLPRLSPAAAGLFAALLSRPREDWLAPPLFRERAAFVPETSRLVPFLADPAAYAECRSRLARCAISFRAAPLEKALRVLPAPFDCLCLSNLADYVNWSFGRQTGASGALGAFSAFVRDTAGRLAAPGARIALAYLYDVQGPPHSAVDEPAERAQAFDCQGWSYREISVPGALPGVTDLVCLWTVPTQSAASPGASG